MVKTNQICYKFFICIGQRVGARARTKALSFFMLELHQHDAAPVDLNNEKIQNFISIFDLFTI
jgi:hypothetical protein